jgi:hypothetical protein
MKREDNIVSRLLITNRSLVEPFIEFSELIIFVDSFLLTYMLTTYGL